MVFVPATNVAQVNLKFTGPNGQTLENVIYFLKGVAWTATALATLLDAVSSWWAGNLRAQTSNQILLTSLAGRDLTTATSVVAERLENPPLAGTNVSAAMPQNVSMAVKFSTGFAGRSFRGRSYFVGLAENAVAGDFVNTVSGNAIITGWAAITVVETTQLVTHVVLSRFSGGLPRVQGVATPINAYTLEDFRVDTQRRRLIGSGA